MHYSKKIGDGTRVVLATSMVLAIAIVVRGDVATAGVGAGPGGVEQVRPSERATPPAPTIEDSQGGMHHFYRRLAAAARREAGATVRVSVYSDSINGWDGVTSALRHALQSRFGDGGKGWVHIAPGWTYQHHRDVSWTFSDDWRTHVVNRGHGPGGRYGFGGVMAADGSRRSSATYATTEGHPAGGAVSRYRLFYQAFPGAGSVRLTVDDGAAVEVATAASEVEDRVHDLRVSDGAHTLQLAVGERNIRLYGVVMERERPGVVVDAVALIGARVARLLRFDPAHWRRQVQLRNPDLLVFWLGGNNVTARQFNRANFIRDYGQAIATARSGRPDASCLIASITDIGERDVGTTLSHVQPVVDAQREVARAQQCGYLNLYETMGGRGTMDRWFHGSPRLATPDYRHLTPAGAQRVGGYFNDALISGYEAFRE